MTTYEILGHNIFTDEWVKLGTIQANTRRGANQIAFRLFGEDHCEFYISHIAN